MVDITGRQVSWYHRFDSPASNSSEDKVAYRALRDRDLGHEPEVYGLRTLDLTDNTIQ